MNFQPSNTTLPSETWESALNVVSDVIFVTAFMILFIFVLIVYFGRKAYMLWFWIFRFKIIPPSWRVGDKLMEIRAETKTKRLSYFFLHCLVVFLFIRILVEIWVFSEHIMQLVTIVNYKSGNTVFPYDTMLRIIMAWIDVRRLFDYTLLYYVFELFCLLQCVWIHLSLIWIDNRSPNGRKRRYIALGIFYSLLVVLHIFSFTTYLTIMIMEFVAIAKYNDTAILEIKRIILYSVGIPASILVTIFAALIVFALGIFVNVMMCKSTFYRNTKATSYTLQRQIDNQKYTNMKFTMATVLCCISFLCRIIGLIFYFFVDLDDYIRLAILKNIPDLLLVSTICFIYWPFQIPILKFFRIFRPIPIQGEFIVNHSIIKEEAGENNVQLLSEDHPEAREHSAAV